MKLEEELDSELLVEQLLARAYDLRDNFNWTTLMDVFTAVNLVGGYLVDRDNAMLWTDACMQHSRGQQVGPQGEL